MQSTVSRRPLWLVPSVTRSHPTLVFTPFSLLTVGPSHVVSWSGCSEVNRQTLNQGLVIADAARNPTLLGENVSSSNAKSLSMLISINLSQIKVPVFCCEHIVGFCLHWNIILLFVSTLSNSFTTAKVIPEQ